MANKNDETILLLKKKVELQREELAKLPRSLQSETSTVFTPPDVDKKSIRVMNVEQLKLLKVQLHMYEMAASDLDMDLDEFTISGFMHDIDMQISVLTRAEKEKKLKETENTLNKLLSDDKRTELELEALAKMLM